MVAHWMIVLQTLPGLVLRMNSFTCTNLKVYMPSTKHKWICHVVLVSAVRAVQHIGAMSALMQTRRGLNAYAMA